jgi:hypothetical protein
MALKREDQTIDSADDLSPVTVKIGEDRDEDLEQDASGDDGGMETQGNEEPTSVPAAARTADRPAPGMTQRPGAPNGQQGSRNRPSKMGWRDLQGVPKQMQEMRTTITQLQGMIQAMQSMGGRPATQEAPQAKPHETQLGSVTKQLQALIEMSADPNLSEGARAKMVSQYNELEGQRRQLEQQGLEERLLEKLQSHVQQNMPDPQVSQAASIVASEFPEMQGNRRAANVAKAYYEDLVQENGGRESVDLLREACAFACASLKLGQSRGPSRMGRAAMAGAGGQNGQRGEDSDPNTVSFDAQDMRIMANPYVTPRQVAEQMGKMRNGR